MDGRHPLPYSSTLLVPPRPPHGPPWRRLKAWLSPPRGDRAILLEAIAWVVGAALLRCTADAVLAALPVLWIPIALVILLPAVLAICLSTWAPPLSLILGYRLILTGIGLLLGGKL